MTNKDAQNLQQAFDAGVALHKQNPRMSELDVDAKGYEYERENPHPESNANEIRERFRRGYYY